MLTELQQHQEHLDGIAAVLPIRREQPREYMNAEIIWHLRDKKKYELILQILSGMLKYFCKDIVPLSIPDIPCT